MPWEPLAFFFWGVFFLAAVTCVPCLATNHPAGSFPVRILSFADPCFFLNLKFPCFHIAARGILVGFSRQLQRWWN